MRPLGAAAWSAIAVLTAGPCSTGALPGARPPATTDTLTAGCAGGVTGGGGGAAITGAGEILRFSHSGPAPRGIEWTLIRRDPTAARRIFSELATADFDRVEFNHPSNMTCSLARRGSAPHAVAWPMGQRPPGIIRIVAVYDEIDRAARAR